MKKPLRLVALIAGLAGLTLPLTSPAAGAVPSPSAVYADLAWLVGGKWVAALPADKQGNVTAIELRLEWASDRQGIRFDSGFARGEKRVPYTSGIYAWNAAKKKFAIVYTDSGGSLSQGDAVMENGVLVEEYSDTSRDGSVDSVRVRLSKVDDNAFTNEIFMQKDGAWKRLILVRYERKP